MIARIPINDLRELRMLHNPPEVVKDLAGALLALLGVIGSIDVRNERDPRLWKHFRNNICNTTGAASLPSKMATFDPKSVTKEQVDMAKRFMKDTSKETVRNVSMAAGSLYMWICKAIQGADS